MSSISDIFNKIFSGLGSDRSSSRPEDYPANIRVIGPRSSGKTVYIAALARWPRADPEVSPVQSVIAVNANGEQLIDKAKNLLEKGEQLEATFMSMGGLDIEAIKDYAIQITLKEQFAWHDFSKSQKYKLVRLNLNCKDYPGEFFNDILYKSGSSLLQSYLQDCLLADGIMLVIDGMGYRQDLEFANGLEKFLKEMDRADLEQRDRRIALVITKCEQPELWVNRDDPQKIIRARFKQVLQHLENWERQYPGNVDYFTASAFGMVGNKYPAPNVECLERKKEGITAAVLKYPAQWKPFGLVAPIYWLGTGKRHELLDKE